MARKVLFAEGGGLATLQTSDTEGIGVLFEDEYGRVYRYVKNASTTDLVATGACLRKLEATTAKGVFQRVMPCDAGTGPASCLTVVPAGMPITGIGASGSSTGCFGWIQVAGPARVTIMPSSTAVDQEAGCIAIATTLFPATYCWGKAETAMLDTDGTPQRYVSFIRMAASLGASTGVTTAQSAVVTIHCLN